MTSMRITHIGGPTTLLEVAGWRILTDPTFDPPGRKWTFGFGSSSRKVTGPAVAAADLGPIDVVLLTHDHHGDNLDEAGRALLPAARRRRHHGVRCDPPRWRHTRARTVDDDRARGTRPPVDHRHGHAVPPWSATESSRCRRCRRIRAHVAGPRTRCALDLRRHRALRRRARGGCSTRHRRRSAASRQCAVHGDGTRSSTR